MKDRENLAKEIYLKMLDKSQITDIQEHIAEYIAEKAVMLADALIKELNKK